MRSPRRVSSGERGRKEFISWWRGMRGILRTMAHGTWMVMMAEPVGKAMAAAKQRQKSAGIKKPRVIHLSPQGRLLNHLLVMELAAEPGLVLLAGRYEGVDERAL